MKKLWAVILCFSLMLAQAGMTGYTSYAQESKAIAEETPVGQTDKTISEEADEPGTEKADPEAEKTNPVTEEAASTAGGAAQGQPAAAEAASQEELMSINDTGNDAAEEASESELKENSWRYSNGELSVQEMYARSYANAWNKENGKFVNSRGEVIPGAVKKGIDVSEHNKKIDWARVKASDIDFAIIRCGYGQDWKTQDDDYWEYNVSECERLGIPYGVYIYSYADTTAKAAGEADHVLRLLKGHSPSYPVYFDMEENSMLSLSKTALANLAKAFCDKVSAAGYRVGVYSNLNWWTNYLTSPVFDNNSWSRWMAQYNYKCDYKSSYDMWQCTSEGKVNGISGNVDLNFWMNQNQSSNQNPSQGQSVAPVQTDMPDIISYKTHVQTYNWQSAVQNGYQSGTTGLSKRIEAIKIEVGSGYGDLGVEYSSHVQGIGWQNPVTSGKLSGTEGQAKRLEAIRIKLTGAEAEKYDIYYRVHAQTFGWLGWAKNGESAGSEGYGKRLEAIQIVVKKKGEAAPGSTNGAFKQILVGYSSHVQTYGWQPTVYDGDMSGTEGKSKRLEGIKISLKSSPNQNQIRYKTHVQTYGWQDWVTGGNVSGTEGQSKRLEAICIELTDKMANNYDVYYRVHAQTYGWLGWAKNGEPAGSEGQSKRLEAIEIVLVEKGGNPPGTVGDAFKK